jgi:hypothetical protein
LTILRRNVSPDASRKSVTKTTIASWPRKTKMPIVPDHRYSRTLNAGRSTTTRVAARGGSATIGVSARDDRVSRALVRDREASVAVDAAADAAAEAAADAARAADDAARLARLRPWLLWAVLVVGVAGLGALVWRLARSGPTAPPP